MNRHPGLLIVMVAFSILLAATGDARAQCPAEPTLDNHLTFGTNVCPCFAVGEQAGATFLLDPAEYPIEVLKIGVGWASQQTGTPDQLEQAVHLYAGGLPNPGAPIFTLPAPQLTDGVINEFNIEGQPGNKIINSGPFTVSLEFMNANDSMTFAPSVIHDGQACIPGRNSVFHELGFWIDACGLGVSGNWVFHVVYRKLTCGSSGTVPNGDDVPGTPLTADFAGGNITLDWGPSCVVTDDDFGVYEGVLGNYYSHSSLDCTTFGATNYTFPAFGGSRYYLVVPHDGSTEGSYGTPTTGIRPQGSLPCESQSAGACP